MRLAATIQLRTSRMRHRKGFMWVPPDKAFILRQTATALNLSMFTGCRCLPP